MATAGNIILNLGRTPGGRYVVRPQGRLFAAAKEEDPMRTVSGLMTTLKQAKGIADMVAPFLSQEYQPPVQQGEIAAQQLDAAQQQLKAAQQAQAQAQAAQAGAQPLPLAPGLGSTQQQLQQSLGVTTGAQPTLSGLQLAPDVATQVQFPQEVNLIDDPVPLPGIYSLPKEVNLIDDPAPLPEVLPLSQEVNLIEDPVPLPGVQPSYEAPEKLKELAFKSPIPGLTLTGPNEQQYLAAEQLGKTSQAVAAAEQAVAKAQQAATKAPPMLPMFNTLAEAEASIRSALMSGNFEEAQRMLAGLEYSPLSDIPQATKIGEIPVGPRRQAAIADMMKRLRIPSELTPARQSLQQQQLDVRQAAIDASRSRTEAMVARAEADRKAKAKLAEEKRKADELKRQQEYERNVTLLGIKQANALKRLEARALTQKELADINNLARLKLGRLQAWSRKEVAKLNNDVRLMTATMQGETATRNRAQRRLNKLLTGNSNAKPNVLKRQLTMMLLRTKADVKKYGALATGLEEQTGAKLPEIAAKISSAKAAKAGAEKLVELIVEKLNTMNATLFPK